MYLNNLQSETVYKKGKRLGRGIGSGKGKTCGRGHKGQKSRAGGFHKVSFEGGQMPLQRRLPKFGFTSYKASVTKTITLEHLKAFEGDEVITLSTLKDKNIISNSIKYVKLVNTGELTKKVTLKGIKATKSAAELITSNGGSIE